MKKYLPVAFLVLLAYMFTPLFIANGVISIDAGEYFKIADDLPQIKTNLFPTGFPFLLWVLRFFAGDYFWASRLLSFILALLILLFSYFKNFYFRETLVLLCAKAFLLHFTTPLSEMPFLAALYFLFYIFHNFFDNKLKNWQFIISASLLMVFMFMIRYSALYIFCGFIVFYIIKFIKEKHFKSFFNNPYFYFLLLSATGIFAYMMIFNHWAFGDFFGEKLRGQLSTLNHSIVRNIFGFFEAFDPFFAIKPSAAGKWNLCCGSFFCFSVFFAFPFSSKL